MFGLRTLIGCLLLSFLVAEVFANLDTKVGINCTENECEDSSPCPPDSRLEKDLEGSSSCVCQPEHCSSPPNCMFGSHLVLKHRGTTTVPGECCDVYECESPPQGRNCTGVVCPKEEEECPEDSYRLPSRQREGACCSVPQGCACLPAPCPRPLCPPHQAHSLITPATGQPGSCCPLYKCYSVTHKKPCMYNNKEVADGTRWNKSECLECQCKNGVPFCSNPSNCPPLPRDCPNTTIPQGECCPLCLSNNHIPDTSVVNPSGCKSGMGVIYENEAKWKEDDCTSCVCVSGIPKCQVSMCQTHCHNATFVKGECCPRCGNDTSLIPTKCPLLNCSHSCEFGYLKDETTGCFTCQCKGFGEEDCKLNCPGGYRKDDSGKRICECMEVRGCPPMKCHKKCRHGYKMNAEGCEVCKCEHCKPINCTKRCPHGLATDHRGCPICKCQSYNLIESAANASFGKEPYPYCSTDFELRDDGEVWYDGCRQCYCLGGKEMCSIISCPKPDCVDTVLLKNSCCPTCPGNRTRSVGLDVVCYSNKGEVKKEGERWSLTGCIECVCHSGRVLCHKEECPPAPCAHPTPPLHPHCCPTCPNHLPQPLELGCGEGREAGSSWREGSCVSCVCVKGEAACYTESCDLQTDFTCEKPLQVKNQCCPICSVQSVMDEEVCEKGNSTYSVGMSWQPTPCRRCICETPRTITCISTCTTNYLSPKSQQNNSQQVLLSVILVFLFMGFIGFGLHKCHQTKKRQQKHNLCSSSYKPCATSEPPPV